MSRFLAYTSPARGHLYPIVPALLELVARGHEVHIRTVGSEIETLNSLGLRAEPLARAIEEEPLDDWRYSTPEEGLAGGLATFARRAHHEVPDLQAAITDARPDALIVDCTTVGAAAVAEASGLRWARWTPYLLHIDVVTGPTTDVQLVPFTLDAELGVVNGPRERLGLPPLRDPSELWRAHLHLYLTAPPFEDASRTYPLSMRLVGPGIWIRSVQTPIWVEEIRDPIVLVTVSSEYQGDDALIEAALKGLEHEDISVVVTTAAHDPERFAAPSNARVTKWLPHEAILPHAAAVVCHGGMGITQKSLSYGVPVCVVPFGRDQAEVASRVLATGAGSVVAPEDLSPVALRDAVLAAMGKREEAAVVARGFANAGGAGAAADHLETLIRSEGAARPQTTDGPVRRRS